MKVKHNSEKEREVKMLRTSDTRIKGKQESYSNVRITDPNAFWLSICQRKVTLAAPISGRSEDVLTSPAGFVLRALRASIA